MSATLPSVATPSLSTDADVARVAKDVKAVAEKPPSVPGALERLALSREQLRMAMLPKPKTARANSGVASFAAHVGDRVKEMPGAAVLTDAVHAWWQKHPLHTVANVGAEAARKFTAPLAERNPLGLILGAVAIGAVLALARPWRWLLRPALFAGLVPAVIARALKELPVDSLMRMFGSGSNRTAAKEPAVHPSAPLATVVTPSDSTGLSAARPSPVTRPAATVNS